MWHELFGGLILGLAAFGIATNIGALALLTQRQLRSRRGSNSGGASASSGASTFGVFHSLLRMLCAFDLMVVICGALSYGLPNVTDAYTARVLPSISPVLIPTVHVALMASVYVTVLISLERSVYIHSKINYTW